MLQRENGEGKLLSRVNIKFIDNKSLATQDQAVCAQRSALKLLALITLNVAAPLLLM